MSVKGKVVVVTGAASGMGREAARLAREQGAYVIGLDKAEVALDLDQKVPIDLTDQPSIDRAVSRIPGPIDHLFNIAGVSMVPPPPVVLKVNFLGQRAFTEALLPRMNTGGSVVNMASVGGTEWRQNLEQVKACLALTALDQAEAFCEQWQVQQALSYKLSKECLIAWTQQCVNRHADNAIRFNTVSPGVVDTPLWAEAFATGGERGKAFLALSPRMIQPEEIANIFLMLCRDDMQLFNGADLAADLGVGSRLNCQRMGL